MAEPSTINDAYRLVTWQINIHHIYIYTYIDIRIDPILYENYVIKNEDVHVS